jgi:hypothetical protein
VNLTDAIHVQVVGAFHPLQDLGNLPLHLAEHAPQSADGRLPGRVAVEQLGTADEERQRVAAAK